MTWMEMLKWLRRRAHPCSLLSHEYNKLELSGFGSGPDRYGAEKLSKTASACRHLSYGDQSSRGKNCEVEKKS